ncbi:DUF86 domain-containing protein [cf. Phormidesmis sp. LEGE 11477]|uniref:type VII toxin-antitoxin system HepT family RNase toxin n=1 Tax=cf. Phormidesmis sp. LEGE 11477 TaxID=1828680 RepID=UPI00188278B1|nr:DUF86 domain-containing protein [cf. Phormidesmis sp. LEGE 11477]MBE9063444.1 DUF86 domain-containing protein [cf. Phormidesmis sp. LEGE 11477]
MTFDQNSVRSRIRLIAGYLLEMDLLRSMELEEILDDVFKYRAAERLQELIIQASIDTNRYILTGLYDKRTKTNADVFIDAEKVGILPLDLAERLAKASGLRNFLAHQYEKINPLIVVESIESICVDFQLYLVCIENYVNSL